MKTDKVKTGMVVERGERKKEKSFVVKDDRL
jgi:hypothetical protein